MIKVVLVDDHTIVRSGFSQLLSLEEDIKVVGEFGTAKEVRQYLPTLQPDVCILDVSMPDENGLDLLSSIPKSISCIMLSVNDSDIIVRKALEYGAKGYLSKRCNPEELIQAVYTVYSGGVYLMPELAIRITSSHQYEVTQQLTKREIEVCELLASGLNTKEVADKLNVSFKTVHTHRANAMSKLNIKNNVELVKLFPKI
ncbi:response regulator [Otariodibacter sp.]|uniref:response regulator n=1 Tax=Otariodibacter sp. TaxID=3030919 RepID=UPI002639E801|nr:response regulator [Otariodibacter sp.]